MWWSFMDPVKQGTPQGEQSHGTERAWASGSFAKPTVPSTREMRPVPCSNHRYSEGLRHFRSRTQHPSPFSFQSGLRWQSSGF